MHAPKLNHIEGAKRILRHIKGVMANGLKFVKGKSMFQCAQLMRANNHCLLKKFQEMTVGCSTSEANKELAKVFFPRISYIRRLV